MGGGVFFMADPLTDLLNRNEAAYTFFFSLSPEMQQLLRQREIHTLQELHRAVSDIEYKRRPPIF